MNIVIIGNSAAGLSCLKNFRKIDKQSKVIMISKEGFQPYSRVLLPYVLRGKLPYSGMTIRDAEFFEENNVECVTGEVSNVDIKSKKVVLADSKEIAYDKLLIATGSYAVMPPIEGIKDEKICNMWTKADVDKLAPLFDNCKKVAVIGSGFVALQAAWAAVVRGLDVTVIELMDRIMPAVLDEKGAEILTEKIKEKGVNLLTQTVTEKIEKNADGSFTLHLKDKENVDADFVIVGTGVRSNTAFLEGSGIEFERGIPVDNHMMTNVLDVYAAGDVAAGPTTFGQEHMIHALWPTAVEMGKIAAQNMAGLKTEYEGSLNMNVTQMYDVTVASMGLYNEKDIDHAEYFDEEDGRGYQKLCYKDGLLVGACLVGSSDAVPLFGKIRPIIRKRKPIECDIHKIEDYTNMKIFGKNK